MLEEPTFDNAINEIRLHIQQQDPYTAIFCSSLYMRGQLLKTDETVSTTAFVDKMGLLFLFDEIRYEMNGTTVDRCRKPGLTALMKGCVSFNQNEAIA
ncbi:hypothetical protein NQ314_006322 [Rhamnusium bicolor]|uniref:Double jelly roll-like domain-containing protein n=1 Tax=Rhamnusium bicolor TaxID=1586634 RepID=A0AAV8Z487_9CUCU|nr:hypothetical protein NQ314_006322 [Rhamnusium bicolor]